MRLFSILGSLLSTAIVVAILTVEFSGISYRKDCATPQGTVARNWQFEWFAPVPFIFRPSEDGCNVHVGSRVLLSAVGVDKIKPETAGGIAAQSATKNGDSAPVIYFAKVYAALTAWTAAVNANPKDVVSDLAATHDFQAKLGALQPPPQLLTGHKRAVAALDAFDVDLTRAANGNTSPALTSSYKAHYAAMVAAFTALQRQAAAAAVKK